MLECVPIPLAKDITNNLQIPTIGIGAGHNTDGQVLVMQDMLGTYNKNPRFVKKYNSLNTSLKKSFDNYDQEVKSGLFPTEKESYS